MSPLVWLRLPVGTTTHTQSWHRFIRCRLSENKLGGRVSFHFLADPLRDVWPGIQSIPAAQKVFVVVSEDRYWLADVRTERHEQFDVRSLGPGVRVVTEL